MLHCFENLAWLPCLEVFFEMSDFWNLKKSGTCSFNVFFKHRFLVFFSFFCDLNKWYQNYSSETIMFKLSGSLSVMTFSWFLCTKKSQKWKLKFSVLNEPSNLWKKGHWPFLLKLRDHTLDEKIPFVLCKKGLSPEFTIKLEFWNFYYFSIKKWNDRSH